MTLRSRATAEIVGGLAAGALVVALAVTSDHDSQRAVTAILAPLVGWAFIGSGILARIRRPENPTGLLLMAVGFAWFLGSLTEANDKALFTAGVALGAVFIAVFVHLLATYPTGRIETPAQRILVVATYFVALFANVSLLLVSAHPGSPDCKNCPGSAMLAFDSKATSDALNVLWDVTGALLALGMIALLVSRWRRASPAARRVLSPVFFSGLATLVLLGLSFATDPASHTAGQIFGVAAQIAFVSVPFFFLAGLLRLRLARIGVGRLLQESDDEASLHETQEGLRRTLKDPTLRIVLWSGEEGGYVDEDGCRVECPQESAAFAVAKLVHDGRPLAAVVHDPSLRTEPALLEDVLNATRLTLVQNRSVEALRASERRNRAILDAIPDDMFRIRRDGTYLDVHSHSPAELQLPVDEMVGAGVRDSMPSAELADRILEVIGRVIDTGESESTEFWLARRKGVRYLEARFVQSGEEEVLAIVRDITDRREAEEQVVRQRDFLSTVVNAASSIFCVVTPEGRVIRYNAACEELTGRPDDDAARGRPFWELFASPEDAESVQRAFESGRAGVVFEHRWAKVSGEPLLIEWSSTPLIDERGEDRRLIHGVDVTERERQEEELRERYTFLSTVGRATPNLLAVIEADGRIGPDGVNGGFEQALGWGDDSIGRPLFELIAPEDPTAETAIAEAIVSGQVVEREGVWAGRDGRRISVAWSIRPLGELSGRRSYLVCGVDVTEQKRQQAELRRSRARIVEVQAAERRRLERNLHDGAQQRLVSLSLALRLAKAKLAADPDGATEILTGASLELALALEELRELARGIHPAVLTDRGLAAALEALASRATVPVELEAVPAVRLPEQVESAAFYVVSEALANVAKYAHASVARVSVTCPDGRAVVEVSDDGVGGADATRGTGLSGLGDRLEALDGRLTVESPVGRGTVVRAVIPLPVGEAAEQKLAAKR